MIAGTFDNLHSFWGRHRLVLALSAMIASSGALQAQTAVSVGSGSYASSVRAADTAALQVVNSYTNLHVASSVTNRPIPSNQWWTDFLLNTFGGQLWAYPVILAPNSSGFNLYFPNAWTPSGSDPAVPQGQFVNGPALPITGGIPSGGSFTPVGSVVTDWSDWGVRFSLPDATTNRMDITLARGVPFVWTICTGVKPRIGFGSVPLYDTNGNVISTSTGGFTNSAFAFDYQGRSFGIFAPDNTPFVVTGGLIEAELSGTNNYLVYGLLPTRANLAEFAQSAYAWVTNTTYAWTYDITNGRVATIWSLATTSLKGSQTNTLQGWLPHQYRTTSNNLVFKPYTYLTPRGVMKVTAGNQFELDFNFRGIAPVLPAPHANSLPNDYVASRMTNYLVNFAAGHPQNIADTYFGGKELGITAQHISFARQLGMTNQAAQLTAGLRTLLANWYTYTPGESQLFFARYGNWRALVGFPVGFGSEAFNDHHFHYGYFALASALLGMEDASFLSQYGPMAKLVAKEYANWERSDTNFPFLRTFDIWEGHSWAGGLSSAGGENQESSSEAINSWVGLFLLGSQLGDSAMTAAGAMGYAVESTAVNEYWQDIYRTNLPASYGKGIVGMVWSGGLTYGTYFSGDPAWIYGIQWVPANHWNNYLARDKAYANWQLTNMWNERVIASQHNLNGFTLSDANNATDLGAYLGNYVLGYQALFDTAGVATIMEAGYAANAAIATDSTYSGVTYYLTHSLRGLGDQDFNYYTSIPSSQVYYNSSTGQRTYVIYNPAATNQTATIYNLGVPVDSVPAPAGKLTTSIAGQTNVSNGSGRISVSMQLGSQISWPTTVNSTWTLQSADAPGTNAAWTTRLGPSAGNGSTNACFDPNPHEQYRVLETTSGTTNIVVNGDFESGSGSAVSNWSAVGSQPAVRVNTDAHGGAFSMQLLVTNPAATPNTSEIDQNIGAAGGVPVMAGQSYNFSFWAKQISYGVSYVQNYRIGWLNSGGGTISSVGYTAFSAGSSDWTQVSATNLVAPANAVNAYLQIYGATGAVSNGCGGVLIDDVSLAYGTVGQTNLLSAGVQPGVQFRWPSFNGKLYDVRWTDNLRGNNWSNLVSSLAGNGNPGTVFDAFGTNRYRFYRVVQLP